jgi:uncharacterized protein involved in exopolysaccharide biosynthesis
MWNNTGLRTDVHTSQFSIYDLTSFIRRRMKYLIIPPVVVAVLCVVGANILPKQYESSTTIWVQPDEILNPLVSTQMAVQLAPPDRLETLMDVVYSRKTIETVIDSAGLRRGVAAGAALDDLVEDIRRNIKTNRSGSDSFTISYMDVDPVRAKKVVSCLAKTFIETRLNAEARRNAQTVEFFEQKLRDYQAKFETTQRELVSLLTQRMKERPAGNTGLSVRLEDIDRQIQRADQRLRVDRDALVTLAQFPDKLHTNGGRQAIGDLRSTELPFSDDLRTTYQRYEEVTARYTPLYPEVGKIEGEVLAVLRRMRTAVEAEQASLATQLGELNSSRQRTIAEMMNYSVDQAEDVGNKSNYNLYQKLYEEMKTKLEQAKITQDLGRNGENSFIILDPPRVPARPSKPNQALIIAGGGIFGIILGIGVALMAEFLDTRMRTLRDLEVYQLPVVALLPEIGSGH